MNVFGFDEKGEIYLLRRSKGENCENDIDLLFISNEKMNHYCWIKDLERLMVQKGHSTHCCRGCLNVFRSLQALRNHKTYCDLQNAVRQEFPKPGTTLSLFCIVIKWTDNIVPLETITYTAKSDDEDVGQIFVDTLERNVKHIYKIQQEKINQFKYIKKEDRKKYESAIKSATTCHICEKELDEDRVIDHCHLTGKFRGAAHTKCTRNYKIPNFIPVFFHNLSGYDSHPFIKKLTRCSAVAERPRCRVRYSFRQK